MSVSLYAHGPATITHEFSFKDNQKLYKLLGAVANVMDLHGDPPDTYELKGDNVPAGAYIKTGAYND